MVDFTREDCRYIHEGNEWTVNYNLAVKHKLDKETVLQIIICQKHRITINQLVKEETPASKIIELYRKILTSYEYRLQRFWGFPEDDRYHLHTRVGV